MFDETIPDGQVVPVTDDFYAKEWSEFVKAVDSLTGGGPIARQLFIDARERYWAAKL